MVDPVTPLRFSQVALSVADVPNYQEGSSGHRCIDCSYRTYIYKDDTEGQGCGLYLFDTIGGDYKPWMVCDSYKTPEPIQWSNASVRLAVVGEKSDDGTVWIELIRTGTHRAGRAGFTAASGQEEIVITAEQIESLHRGTQVVLTDGRHPTGIPIRGTPDHSDESTPSVGRVKETQVDTLDDGVVRLLGRVKWSARGEEIVLGEEYDSVSIEADPPGTVEHRSTGEPVDDWAMLGVVITNHPFIGEMEPLAATVRAPDQQETDMDLKNLALAVGKPEDAAEAVILVEIENLKLAASKVPVLEESVTTLTTDRDALKASLDTLSAAERDRVIEQACVDNRITAGEKEQYGRALSLLPAEDVEATYPIGRIKGASRAAGGGGDPDTLSPQDAVIAEVRAAAKALVDDKGMEPAAAHAEAMSLVMSDPIKAAAYSGPVAN